MTLSTSQRKWLKSIGHKLKPIVTIADKGLTENLIKEVNRALDDHELIKIKVHAADRDSKRQLIEQACSLTHAELIQTIGHIALLYRRAKSPKHHLSNLTRQPE